MTGSAKTNFKNEQHTCHLRDVTVPHTAGIAGSGPVQVAGIDRFEATGMKTRSRKGAATLLLESRHVPASSGSFCFLVVGTLILQRFTRITLLWCRSPYIS